MNLWVTFGCCSAVLADYAPTDQKALLEPFTYLTATSGKEIRKKFIEAFNLWLNVPNETVLVISRVVSMLHSASLMFAFAALRMVPILTMFLYRIDDVEDDSQLRRGQPGARALLTSIYHTASQPTSHQWHTRYTAYHKP